MVTQRGYEPALRYGGTHTAMWFEGLTSFRLIIIREREGGQGMHQNWRAWCFGTFHPVRWKVPPNCEISDGIIMVGSSKSKYRAFI